MRGKYEVFYIHMRPNRMHKGSCIVGLKLYGMNIRKTQEVFLVSRVYRV